MSGYSRLFVLLLAGLALRLFIAWQPLDLLLKHCVADDMFYYLKIATHIVSGKGVTFDGETLTNGFHPLYLLTLLPLAKIAKSPEQFTHLALSWLSLISVLATVPIFRMLRRFNPYSALLASALWLFHPYSIAIGLSGVEVPLSAFCIGMAAWMYMRFFDLDATEAIPKMSGWLGFFVGLACLSRTDNIFLFITFLIAALKIHRRAYVLAFLMTVLPWILWSLFYFGRFSQDSGNIIAYRYHELFRINVGSDGLNALPHLLLENVITSQKMVMLRLGGIWGLSLLVYLLWRFRKDLNRLRLFLPMFPFMLFLALHRGFYTLYFWHQQYWYLFSPLFVIVLLTGYLDRLYREQMHSKMAQRVYLLWILLAFVFLAHEAKTMIERPFYPWQPVYLNVARSSDNFFENDTRVGAFNAGILGFFSQAKVVNLDGVVNPEAGVAIREHKIGQYLENKKIDVLIDQEHWIQMFSYFAERDFLGRFAVITRFETQTRDGPIFVLRRLPKKQ